MIALLSELAKKVGENFLNPESYILVPLDSNINSRQSELAKTVS